MHKKSLGYMLLFPIILLLLTGCVGSGIRITLDPGSPRQGVPIGDLRFKKVRICGTIYEIVRSLDDELFRQGYPRCLRVGGMEARTEFVCVRLNDCTYRQILDVCAEQSGCRYVVHDFNLEVCFEFAPSASSLTYSMERFRERDEHGRYWVWGPRSAMSEEERKRPYRRTILDWTPEEVAKKISPFVFPGDDAR